ncbi:MAG TPA: MotA/TolQ/ExbB proton channel family protein [Epsilonproteobacteria bacterium]|nr:MotA/TolQ/ExbB proton channel family protein [Campylobacterota bacterium]
MSFLELIAHFVASTSTIILVVILVLSFYFILTFWVFIDRYNLLKNKIKIEAKSLKDLYMGRSDTVDKRSLLYAYTTKESVLSKELLQAASTDLIRSSTKHLTILAVISSTSPFIGLFGTVIGILETFAALSGEGSASLSVIAPAISEALFVTAVGIFVAIFAYTFHLVLKREAFELNSLLDSESKIILARKIGETDV